MAPKVLFRQGKVVIIALAVLSFLLAFGVGLDGCVLKRAPFHRPLQSLSFKAMSEALSAPVLLVWRHEALNRLGNASSNEQNVYPGIMMSEGINRNTPAAATTGFASFT